MAWQDYGFLLYLHMAYHDAQVTCGVLCHARTHPSGTHSLVGLLRMDTLASGVQENVS